MIILNGKRFYSKLEKIISNAYCCGGDDQQKKEEEAANKAAEQQRQAGIAANQQITKAGQPSAVEQQYQGLYNQKAMQPAETTMQEGGPIAQALSQRILERSQNPGMDYDVANINTAIGTPVWAGLKARGITAPAGSQGGGLGTEQYMQQMVPYLAQGRQAQINTDISNATNYGQLANALQQYYTTGRTNLANLLQNRQLQAAIPGAQTQYGGAVTGAQTQLSGANLAAAQQYAQQQALMSGIGSTVGAVGGSVLEPVGTAVGGALGNALVARMNLGH